MFGSSKLKRSFYSSFILKRFKKLKTFSDVINKLYTVSEKINEPERTV